MAGGLRVRGLHDAARGKRGGGRRAPTRTTRHGRQRAERLGERGRRDGLPTSTASDGPCHNTIHCLRGGNRRFSGTTRAGARADWAGWYTPRFSSAFSFGFVRSTLRGPPSGARLAQKFHNGLCWDVLFCILLSALWEYIVKASYGMTQECTLGMSGRLLAFAAIALSAYTRHRMARDDEPARRWSPSCGSASTIVQIGPPDSHPGMPWVRIPDGRIVSVPIPARSCPARSCPHWRYRRRRRPSTAGPFRSRRRPAGA